MLNSRAANEKILRSFQQNGVSSKVNTLCKLNKIIFALPSTLTSSPGNKSSMLQPTLQPQKTSGAGMKGTKSGQVLLRKFAVKIALNFASHELLTFCLHVVFSVLFCMCVSACWLRSLVATLCFVCVTVCLWFCSCSVCMHL